MAKKSETKFKERIKPLLESLPNSWWVKTQMLAVRGIPDYLGCVSGRFIALELKPEDREPDKLQGWVLSRIGKAGGIGVKVWPGNWEKTYEMLKDISLKGQRE